MESEKQKEVLVAFGERRRAVSFQASTDPLRERLSLEEAIRSVFKDVLNEDSHLVDLVILVKSEKWNGEFVELQQESFVDNNSIVHLSVDAKKSHLQVSQDLSIACATLSPGFEQVNWLINVCKCIPMVFCLRVLLVNSRSISESIRETSL